MADICIVSSEVSVTVEFAAEDDHPLYNGIVRLEKTRYAPDATKPATKRLPNILFLRDASHRREIRCGFLVTPLVRGLQALDKVKWLGLHILIAYAAAQLALQK